LWGDVRRGKDVREGGRAGAGVGKECMEVRG